MTTTLEDVARTVERMTARLKDADAHRLALAQDLVTSFDRVKALEAALLALADDATPIKDGCECANCRARKLLEGT